MSENQCLRCSRPTPDGYACTTCGITKPTGWLTELIEISPAARDIAYGLSSSQGSGGASGKPESRLPLNLAAAARLDAVANELGTWVRHVVEERGQYPAQLPYGSDPIPASARFLVEHLEWMRHRPECDEFLTDMETAARVLRGIVRGPAAHRYLGPCGSVRPCEGLEPDDWPEADCGDHTPHDTHDREPCDGDVYARDGASVGRCRTCKAEVSTAERQAWLDEEVRSHAYTATEIAEAYPSIKANTIRQWLSRGLLVAHGEYQARPLLNLGEVLDLAAGDAARREEARARRAAARETAEMGA